jgi:hypothetical protein
VILIGCELFSELENFLVTTQKNYWGNQCMNITMHWTVRLLKKASKAVSRCVYHIYCSSSLPSTVLRIHSYQIICCLPTTVFSLECSWSLVEPWLSLADCVGMNIAVCRGVIIRHPYLFCLGLLFVTFSASYPGNMPLTYILNLWTTEFSFSLSTNHVVWCPVKLRVIIPYNRKWIT